MKKQETIKFEIVLKIQYAIVKKLCAIVGFKKSPIILISARQNTNFKWFFPLGKWIWEKYIVWCLNLSKTVLFLCFKTSFLKHDIFVIVVDQERVHYNKLKFRTAIKDSTNKNWTRNENNFRIFFKNYVILFLVKLLKDENISYTITRKAFSNIFWLLDNKYLYLH